MFRYEFIILREQNMPGLKLISNVDVINNTLAPSYKLAKYLNKKLRTSICLPYTYNTKNSQEIAEELKPSR